MGHLLDQLDRSLRDRGEDIELRQPRTGPVTSRLTVRGRMRGFTASELVGSITQTDMNLIMSPSEIDAAGTAWPGTGLGRYPRKGDRLGARGEPHVIQSGGPVIVGGEVVRLEYVVRGGA